MSLLPGLTHQEHRNYGLDIVRTLAISMVWIMHSIQEIFHFEVPYLWYISLGGVDLFFSLSGFLIGRILLTVFSKPGLNAPDIAVFWFRRWLRTLPLYFIAYFIYLFIYNLFFYPVYFDTRYMFFLQNIFHAPHFFGESWSLSIEEWFYLCIPAVIFILCLTLSFIFKKGAGRIAFLACTIALIFCMLIVRQTLGWQKIENEAVLFRMDSIAYGLLAAWFSTKIISLKKTNSVLLVTVGFMVWAIAAILKTDPHINYALRTFYYPLAGTGTALLTFGLCYYPFQKKLWIVSYTSVISYSIYLIHLSGILIPLGILTKGLHPATLFITWLLSFPVIFFLSAYSYKYIESYFLRLRNRFAA